MVCGVSFQHQRSVHNIGSRAHREGRRLIRNYRSQRLHGIAGSSLPPSQLVSSAPISQPILDTHIYPARIIANQPLRAKEASPFIDHKYAIVVCTLALLACRTCSCAFRITNMMHLSWALVAPDYERRSVWRRRASTQHAYRSCSPREVTR